MFFLKRGLNEHSDFLFIINGTCSVKIPALPNVKIIQRDNEGFDFGAWTEGLNYININQYDYFIFLNTSVRGPYLKNKHIPWQRQFTDMLSDDVKLVGTTINICTMDLHQLRSSKFKKPYTHVQSQVFCVDRECLLFLKDKIFVPHNSKHSFEDVIAMKEVSMSQYVLHNNWNITCMLPLYQNVDYRKVKKDFNETSLMGDPSFKGRYFGDTYSPYEVVFIKTNRDVFEGYTDYIAPLTDLLPVIILVFTAVYKLTRKN